MHQRTRTKLRAAPLAAGLTAIVIAGCGGGSGDGQSGGPATAGAPAAAAGGRVLPVPRNPISSSATAPGLTITKALVENNVSPSTGKAVDDHLEVVMRNTRRKPLSQIDVYYKITDPAKSLSEGYLTKLTGVTIAPGASQVVHFDNTGAKGHFPVNKYSLYYADKNALVVDLMASSPNLKPATFTVKKDAGGAEAGVE